MASPVTAPGGIESSVFIALERPPVTVVPASAAAGSTPRSSAERRVATGISGATLSASAATPETNGAENEVPSPYTRSRPLTEVGEEHWIATSSISAPGPVIEASETNRKRTNTAGSPTKSARSSAAPWNRPPLLPL